MSRHHHARKVENIESTVSAFKSCASCQVNNRTSGSLEYRAGASEFLPQPVCSPAGADRTAGAAVSSRDIMNVFRGAEPGDKKIDSIKELQKKMGYASPEDFRMAVLNDVLKDPKLLEGLNQEGLRSMQAALKELRRNYHPSDGGINVAQLDAELEVAKRLGADAAAVAKMRSEIIDSASSAGSASKPAEAPVSPQIQKEAVSLKEWGIKEEEQSRCTTGNCPSQTRRKGSFSSIFRR